MIRNINFIGHRRRWYALSALLLIVSIAALGFKGLNLGIEFRGGGEYTVSSASCSVEQARTAAESAGSGQAIVTSTSTGQVRVQTEASSPASSAAIVKSLASTCADGDVSAVKVQIVGPSWGGEITKKAVQGLLIFLALVAVFLAVYFEWRMAVAALIALVHDVVITVGVYALTGLEVTPATVIGILTILGYSLYDTVVVFDRVKEDTRGITSQSDRTWDEAANAAVNETLARSINTTLVALLPVLAIIIVGAGVLGAGTLLDLAVALAVGMAVGAYSSIFVATPVLAEFKNRSAAIKSLSARVAARRSGKARAEQVQPVAASGGSVDDSSATVTVADAPSPSAGRAQPRRKPRSKRG